MLHLVVLTAALQIWNADRARVLLRETDTWVKATLALYSSLSVDPHEHVETPSLSVSRERSCCTTCFLKCSSSLKKELNSIPPDALYGEAKVQLQFSKHTQKVNKSMSATAESLPITSYCVLRHAQVLAHLCDCTTLCINSVAMVIFTKCCSLILTYSNIRTRAETAYLQTVSC